MEIKPSFQRIEYLDSIRGIAAFMVVIYHFIGWRWGDYTTYHAASIVFNGSDAVSFFFVLSGLVLSYKYFHTDAELNLPRYTYKRILRLYPAFIVTILINYFYWNRGMIMDGQWLGIMKDMFLENRKGLWQELVMVRNAHKYYIPGWTMGVEMALSLLMPLFIYIGKHRIKMIWWFLFISLVMGNYMSGFVFHFILGTLIAYYYPQIRDYNWKKSKWFKFRYLIYLGVLLLFSIRHIDRIVTFPVGYHHVANMLKIDFFHFTGFASACILLWVILNKRVQKMLVGPVLLFLGKISYSIYLMHWIFVVYIMDNWDSLMSNFDNWYIGFSVLLGVHVIGTLITATIMYYLVEKPFINIARKSKRFLKVDKT